MDIWSGGLAESALTGHREASVRNGGTQGLNKFNLPGPNDRARGLTAEMSPWPVSEARFRISSYRVERARDHWGALDTTQKHSLAGIYFIDDVPGLLALGRL